MATVGAKALPGIDTPRTVRAQRGWAAIFRHNELTLLGGGFLLFVIIVNVAAPWLAPHDPVKIDIPQRLQAPSLAHPFGTDEFGRDLLSRVMYGGRPVLLTSLLSVLAAMLAGTAIGVIAGYLGGHVDNLFMRLIDVMLSFPAVLLAILIVASLGTGVANAIIAITFSLIPIFARVARALTLSLVVDQFVLAARAVGASGLRVVARHILPNLLPPLIVQATAMLAIAIAFASALSFLGLGVEPPTPDWGLMVSEGQRLIYDALWVPFFPGLAITLTVLAVNFLGDGLRDRLDPTLRNR
ncbi:MAG: peptide ABC transporter substrate-binding protein [Chloroflexota bacterium]|nr:ABC transporter permease [Caldilinea sp.]GIK75120.1 MAG: peptide ABC transporter substrate-binding protein [Chloroflexota bacterium]